MTGHRRDVTLSSINRFCDVCLPGFENARVDQCWSAFCKHAKLNLKKQVFNFDLKTVRVGLSLISRGNYANDLMLVFRHSNMVVVISQCH